MIISENGSLSVEKDRPSAATPSELAAEGRDYQLHLALDSQGVSGGEFGTPFDHNGSKMLLFERAGFIVYDRPKRALFGTVRRGDVLFSGDIDSRTGRIDGVARVFKEGCAPAPYRVSGKARDFAGGEFTLRGEAPVRDRASCAIVGSTSTGGNATLRFVWDGGDT